MSGGMDELGLENAAILLMSIGEEEASEVFKHLTPKEVQRLGETISKMKSITRERVDGVIESFERVAASESLLVTDNNEYVKAVLRRALGEDKAGLLIDRIMQGNDVTGIESLKWMDPSSVGELLRNEHPQIVAVILVHLEFDQAGEVIKLFTERHRNEVMVRIATLDGVQPTALRDLNEVMGRVLASGERTRRSNLGGVKAAAEILNLMGAGVETAVLDFVREADVDVEADRADDAEVEALELGRGAGGLHRLEHGLDLDDGIIEEHRRPGPGAVGPGLEIVEAAGVAGGDLGADRLQAGDRSREVLADHAGGHVEDDVGALGLDRVVYRLCHRGVPARQVAEAGLLISEVYVHDRGAGVTGLTRGGGELLRGDGHRVLTRVGEHAGEGAGDDRLGAVGHGSSEKRAVASWR